MRRIPGLLFCILFFLSCPGVNAQSKNFRRIKCFRVPGAVYLNDIMAVRATEITVREYLEFIAENNFNKNLYPDSLLIKQLPWKELLDDLTRQNKMQYFVITQRYPGIFLKIKKQGSREANSKLKSLALMPVTGISFEQAAQYCRWLEEKYNLMASKFTVCRIMIRLPSVDMYRQWIQDSDSICNGDCTDNCGYNFNYLDMQCDKKSIISAEKTANKLVRADRFKPDAMKLYNLKGNAAEMTEEAGTCMGGSYMHYAKDCYSKTGLSYTKPEPWLGFRFVVIRK